MRCEISTCKTVTDPTFVTNQGRKEDETNRCQNLYMSAIVNVCFVFAPQQVPATLKKPKPFPVARRRGKRQPKPSPTTAWHLFIKPASRRRSPFHIWPRQRGTAGGEGGRGNRDAQPGDPLRGDLQDRYSLKSARTRTTVAPHLPGRRQRSRDEGSRSRDYDDMCVHTPVAGKPRPRSSRGEGSIGSVQDPVLPSKLFLLPRFSAASRNTLNGRLCV